MSLTKKLSLLSLLAILPVLSSCSSAPKITSERLATVMERMVLLMDQNHDQQITKEEIDAARQDPAFWTAIGSLLLEGR